MNPPSDSCPCSTNQVPATITTICVSRMPRYVMEEDAAISRYACSLVRRYIALSTANSRRSCSSLANACTTRIPPTFSSIRALKAPTWRNRARKLAVMREP